MTSPTDITQRTHFLDEELNRFIATLHIPSTFSVCDSGIFDYDMRAGRKLKLTMTEERSVWLQNSVDTENVWYRIIKREMVLIQNTKTLL